MDKGNSSLIERMLMLFVKNVSSVNIKADDAQVYNDFALQLGNFLDKMPIGFFIYNADSEEKILYGNNALVKIFGCDDYEDFIKLVGGSFKGIVYESDLDLTEKSIQTQIANASDALDYVEYRIKRKDGEIRYVEDYGHFIKNKDFGNIYYVYIADCTEKVQKRNLEKAALISEHEEQKNKLRNIIEEYDKRYKLIHHEHLRRLEVIEGLSINYESILYADIQKNTILPYRLSTRFKRQFENKMEPKALDWVLDDYVKVWVHPEDKEYVTRMTTSEYMVQRLTESPTYYINYRCIEDGELIYLQLRAANVSKNKDNMQVVLGYRRIDAEVTQELKKKKLLQEALDSAKAAEVAKNTFLSNMSHDMRTPINALYGYTALLRKNASDANSVLEYAKKIDEANNELLNIVDNLLDISYMEAHDYSLKEKVCKLSDILNKICDGIRLKINKDILLSLDCSGIKHDTVYADEEKVMQMLGRIVSNAVKYTGNGGRVDISVNENSVAQREYSEYKVSVADTGIGISKDALERIFEPFERENNTTQSGVFGAGLGLTIARHIAHQLGGEITVESELGKGSTFTVSISLRTVSAETADGGAADEKFNPEGMNILLVEDNEINIEIETEILSDIGFNVDTAENGKIALELLKSSDPLKYDFVLMDIQMPVLDGLAASRAIRNFDNPKLANIPIIALSANAFETDKRDSFEAGTDAHLTKPLDVDVLLKTAATAISARRKNRK